jgi:hypothetical protein
MQRLLNLKKIFSIPWILCYDTLLMKLNYSEKNGDDEDELNEVKEEEDDDGEE